MDKWITFSMIFHLQPFLSSLSGSRLFVFSFKHGILKSSAAPKLSTNEEFYRTHSNPSPGAFRCQITREPKVTSPRFARFGSAIDLYSVIHILLAGLGRVIADPRCPKSFVNGAAVRQVEILRNA